MGAFCGKSKPKPLDSFLDEFINEVCALLTNGLTFQNKKIRFEIHSFVCDAPARSYLKCIKSHGGYHSCERCDEPGDYVEGRIIFYC